VTNELSGADTVFGNQDDSQAKLWLGVPKKIFRKYAKDNEYKQRALKLLEEGRVGTTVFYKKDMNLKRWALMQYMFYNYYGRYKRYFAENKGDN
jgi:D-aspartate ligase